MKRLVLTALLGLFMLAGCITIISTENVNIKAHDVSVTADMDTDLATELLP